MPDLSVNVSLNLADVFQKSLQIQQSIQQSVQTVLGSGVSSYGRLANTYTGQMFNNLTPNAFSSPGMFPPVTYNPPAWLYQPWGLQGMLAQQGYYGSADVGALLARQYNALPGWLGGSTSMALSAGAGGLGMNLLSIGFDVFNANMLIGGFKPFLKNLVTLGPLKAIQKAPLFGFGWMTRAGAGIGRSIAERFGAGALVGEVGEVLGTAAGLAGAWYTSNALYAIPMKVADEFIKGISTNVHMYNQAARIGQTWIRPNMFGGRGFTMEENQRFARLLTEQRIRLEEEFPWLKSGNIAAIQESAVGIAMANPMAQFIATRNKDAIAEFMKEVEKAKDAIAKLGTSTLQTTAQLGSAAVGFAQLGLSRAQWSKNIIAGSAIGYYTGQGFESITQQNIAAANRFLGTGIGPQLGINLSQTAQLGTYGAIYKGALDSYNLVQLGGAQQAAQTVTIGMQNFVMSPIGATLLSGLFTRNGQINPNALNAGAMGLASAAAGVWGASPTSYLTMLNQRGRMFNQLNGQAVNSVLLSFARQVTGGSNDPRVLAGALQAMGIAQSAPEADAIIAQAQNVSQAAEEAARLQNARLQTATQYAMRKQFMLGNIVGAIFGNREAGIGAEIGAMRLFRGIGGFLQRSAVGAFNAAVMTPYIRAKEAINELMGLPPELGDVTQMGGIGTQAGLFRLATTRSGERISVASRRDLEYFNKHGETFTKHVLDEMNSVGNNFVNVLAGDYMVKESDIDAGDLSNWRMRSRLAHWVRGAAFDYFNQKQAPDVEKIAIDRAEQEVRRMLGGRLPSSAEDTEKILKSRNGAALLAALGKGGYIIPTYRFDKSIEKKAEKTIGTLNLYTRVLRDPHYRAATMESVEKNLPKLSLWQTIKNFGLDAISPQYDTKSTRAAKRKFAEKLSGEIIQMEDLPSNLGEIFGLDYTRNQVAQYKLSTIENLIKSVSREEAISKIEKMYHLSAAEATAAYEHFISNLPETAKVIHNQAVYRTLAPNPTTQSKDANGNTAASSSFDTLIKSMDEQVKTTQAVTDALKQVKDSLKDQLQKK